MLRDILIVVQTVSFMGLGVLLLVDGQTRLGAAQLALAFVTVLVYA